jgi:hypothetical protein
MVGGEVGEGRSINMTILDIRASEFKAIQRRVSVLTSSSPLQLPQNPLSVHFVFIYEGVVGCES